MMLPPPIVLQTTENFLKRQWFSRYSTGIARSRVRGPTGTRQGSPDSTLLLPSSPDARAARGCVCISEFPSRLFYSTILPQALRFLRERGIKIAAFECVVIRINQFILLRLRSICAFAHLVSALPHDQTLVLSARSTI